MPWLKTPFFTVLAPLFMVSASFGADSVDGRLYANVDGPLAVDMVKEATSTLDIEIYTLSDPTIMQEITRAANRGVKIRIVKDPTPAGGETCKWFSSTTQGTTQGNDTNAVNADCSALANMLSAIKDGGGKIIAFDKTTQCGSAASSGTSNQPVCFEHGKVMIVDGKDAWLSTGNLDATNLCLPGDASEKCNRDFAWEITDSAIVSSLSMIFDHDFTNSRTDLGSKVDSGEIDSRLTVSPYSRDSLTAFIDSAKKSIIVQNQYLKDDAMNAALVRAAQRGVKVQVEVASFCAFGAPSKSDRTKATKTYTAFDKAGIESRAFTSAIRVGGRPGYLHAKYMVVDGTSAWVGSINGSKTAIDENREFGVFATNGQAITLLTSLFKSDFTADGAESWQDSLDCAKDLVDQ